MKTSFNIANEWLDHHFCILIYYLVAEPLFWCTLREFRIFWYGIYYELQVSCFSL